MAESSSRNKIAVYLTVFLGILLAWNIFLNFQEAKDTHANFMYAVAYSAFYLFIAGLGFWKLSKVGIKSATSKALLFMSIGALLFQFGFWLYTYFIYKFEQDVPYPSAADFLFLSFVPFVAIGFSYLIKIFAPVLSRRVIWETLLITLVGAGLAFWFLILPAYDPEVGSLERVLNIIYPLNDTILISMMLIALRASGGKIKGYFLNFIIAFILMIIGDVLYSYRTSNETQWNGDIVDLVFTFTAYAYALAVLKMSESVVEPKATFNPEVETQEIPAPSQG